MILFGTATVIRHKHCVRRRSANTASAFWIITATVLCWMSIIFSGVIIKKRNEKMTDETAAGDC